MLRTVIIGLGLLALLQGCKEVECGEGTIERDGACQPADVVVDPATCGPNTMAVGDQCLPVFEPTTCDPATTEEDLDPETNVTTCIGTGGGGCGAALPCPQPSAGKQTICGQLYHLETGENFAAADATAARCDPTMPAAAGPCALRINPYDAVAFAMDPTTAPLDVGDRYIDDCGRFRLTDVMPGSSPFIALGMDDVDPTKAGPQGATNATGIALAKAENMSTRDVEMFAIPATTTTKWAQTGGPTIAGGIYVMLFRQRRAPSRLTQAGVTAIKNAAPAPADDYYFVATDVTRERVDPAATTTGANGTALVTNVALDPTKPNTGASSLPAGCRWSLHLGRTVPGVVFVQILRPIDDPSTGDGTCDL